MARQTGEHYQGTSIDEPNKDSPPSRKGPRNRTYSDSAVDYHEYRNQKINSSHYRNAQDNSDPRETISLPREENDEQDTDDTEEGTNETEDHPQQDGQRETSKSGIKADPKVITPIVLQAYFFSKELADKMNATEIKETFNQQKGHKNIACSVLQLKYPYEGHFIYFHTFEGRFKLPYECTLFTGFRVTLEPPRKKIDRLCDCKKVDWGYNC